MGNDAFFAGVSGEYYVASILAYKNLHVGMVHQGGEAVDLLVSEPGGVRSTTLQIKSRGQARRRRKKDNTITGFDFFIGKSILSRKPSLIYALVDLKDWSEGLPDVYVLRAGDLQVHFRSLMEAKPEIDWERNAYIFQPKPEQIEPYKNEWSPLWEDLQMPGG